MPDSPPASPVPEATSRITGLRLRVLIPLVVASGFLMEQLDSTIITTAIPNIAESLGETPIRLNIAITSYLLSLAVFIPVSGWIADRFGARIVICAAFAIFTAASAACGFATSLEMLVTMRIVQGIGGAMMTPVGRLILFRTFPKAQLVTAMSFVSIPSLLGPTMGPLLGGVLTTYATWRWIFFVNIPFGLLAIVIAWKSVQDAPDRPPPPRFDVAGFAMCGCGLAMLQFVLETIGRGAIPLGVDLAILAGGAAFLLAFTFYARGRSHPVLDLTLFRIRTFRVGSLAGGLARIAINAPTFVLPLMLQVGFGYSPMQSGSATFLFSVGAVAVRPLSGRMLRRFGFRRLLAGNAVTSAVFIASFALMQATTPYWLLAGFILLYGVVRSIQFNGLQMLSYAEMPANRLSAATSLGSVVQQLTMGLGVSFSAALLGILAVDQAGVTADMFRVVFLTIAVLPLLGIPGFLSLSAEDGVEVSGHRRVVRQPQLN
jgi:EmrB/QacA subfamily drug resistance transporter